MTTLGELSAGIAHELNQPLNAIKMGNELLKMLAEKGDVIPKKYVRQITGEVDDQVNRASDIINRLRDFGRKADFEREEVDINLCINNVLSIVGKQFSLRNINMNVDLDSDIPPITGQRNSLDQVIFNLLTNARDAIIQKMKTPTGQDEGVITIRTEKEDGSVVLTVSDTGTGISAAAMDRVYEPFFTTKEVGEGMGLGLSITYGIVKEFGGEITVDSREGLGTSFKISFPAATAEKFKKVH